MKGGAYGRMVVVSTKMAGVDRGVWRPGDHSGENSEGETLPASSADPTEPAHDDAEPATRSPLPEPDQRRPVVVVMGVTATGKTTIGELLAKRLSVPYAEADTFHSEGNIAKMRQGVPLDDADRWPWLDTIARWAHERAGHGGVVSCSALTRAYRDRLRGTEPHLFFVHLNGPRALIADRLTHRRGHFMPLSLLDSQLAALEPLQPDETGVEVSIAPSPLSVTELIYAAIDSWRPAD